MSTFFALLHRDLRVAGRHAVPLLLSALAQPALVVLVFGNLLPRIGLVSPQFGAVMVPGLMAIAILMAGVQGVLMPLATDLSGTREIEERLLAPIGTFGIASERVVAGALHAGLAGLAALPVMVLLMHRVSGVTVEPRWFLLLPLVLLCGALAASFGLLLGTLVQPRMSGLLFAVLIGPMMLFGCAYYPFSALGVLGGARYLFLLNPLVFMSETLRVGVTPREPHMAWPLLLGGLGFWIVALATLAFHSFRRRTIL